MSAVRIQGKVNVLVTGGTGFVGKAVIARLVDQDQFGRIYMLTRARGSESAADRVQKMLGQMFPKGRVAEIMQRVMPIDGDFTVPGLGLNEESLALLRREVHHILHCGASTDFGASIEQARKNNSDGTLHMLQLAEDLKLKGVLERLDYVSTAYVCGTKRGIVTENDLDRGQKFSNSYEQSKFEAELLVRQYAKKLPISVYRPSIVVGHSYNGYTPHFKVLYWPILLIAKNLLPFIACNPRAYLDVVPVDYVADGIVALMKSSRAVGQTYLLTAGLGGEIRIRDILRDAYELAGIKRRPIIRFWMFDLVAKTPLRHFIPERVWTVANLARPYFSYLRGNSVRFDASKTISTLEEFGVTPPRWQDYKREILNFCLASRWGRRLPLPEYSYYLPAKFVHATEQAV